MRPRHRGLDRTRPLDSDPGESETYWMSYGDLFAGLLLVFALILLSALYFYQSRIEGVGNIINLRAEIVEDLRDAFAGQEPQLVAIEDDGTVRFQNTLLFDQNSAELRMEARQQIEVFAEQYIRVILGTPRFRDHISRIVVEGHTNDDGEYFYNLQLSQDRAYTVMEAMMSGTEGQWFPLLMEKMTAVGRSYADLIYEDDAETLVDSEASRRTVVRLDLDDRAVVEELLQRILSR